MEDQKERLIRYLDDAWAVEKALVTALEDMSKEVDDQNVSQFFSQHRQVTHQQEERLEARIRALGAEPSGGKGFFSGMMSHVGEFFHKPHDKFDETTQDLMKQYAVENFEMAMYQSLISYSEAIGDFETASVARQNLNEERQAADAAWQLIQPTAIRPAQQTTQQAQAA